MSSADFDRAAYHAAAARGERISFHSLMDFAHNGKEYHARCIGALPPKEETRAMFFGRAAHKYILEGREAFDAEYKVADGPINARTGKPFGADTNAYREWLAQQDKEIVFNEEAAQIKLMAKAVNEHDFASQLFANGTAETPLYFHWCGLPCQSCLDWYHPHFKGGERTSIVDLKTTSDLDQFIRQAEKLRYFTQLAFYRRAYEENAVLDADCWLVAVEIPRANGPAPRCKCWRIAESVLRDGEDWCMTQLNELTKQRNSNVWLDYCEGYSTYEGRY